MKTLRILALILLLPCASLVSGSAAQYNTVDGYSLPKHRLSGGWPTVRGDGTVETTRVFLGFDDHVGEMIVRTRVFNSDAQALAPAAYRTIQNGEHKKILEQLVEQHRMSASIIRDFDNLDIPHGASAVRLPNDRLFVVLNHELVSVYKLGAGDEESRRARPSCCALLSRCMSKIGLKKELFSPF